MNNSLEYQHLQHQEQESWSMTSLKRYQQMILMDHMDGTLTENRYTTYASNIT